MRMHGVAAIIAIGVSVAAGQAAAQGGPVRIGVLNDQSSVYADYQGLGSVLAAQMAVEDYGGKVLGRAIEVVTADHQNKTDVGAGIARKWYESDGVSAVFDVPNSAVALAVAELARNTNKGFVGTGAGTPELTGSQMSANNGPWTSETRAFGQSL